MKPPGELFTIGGRRVHMLRRGSGSPVVIFEAGAGQVSSTWLPVLEGVAPFATACTWDRPGYGWSQKSSAPLDLDSVTATLAALLDAAELRPPYVLVGWSLGGFYVRRFAQLHGDEVAGVVLVDPSHERMLEGVSRPMLVVMQTLRALQRSAPGTISRLARPRMTKEAARLFPNLSPEELAELVAVATRPGSLRVQFAEVKRVLAQARALPAVPGALGKIPLLVLAAGKLPGGARFREHREGVQLPELTGLSSAGELQVVKDADHSLPLKHPELVVDAVRRVVDQLELGEATARPSSLAARTY